MPFWHAMGNRFVRYNVLAICLFVFKYSGFLFQDIQISRDQLPNSAISNEPKKLPQYISAISGMFLPS